MKTFTTEIGTPEGIGYDLQIHSINKGGIRSEIIQLFIAISTKTDKNVFTETLAVRFNLATHSYKAIEKIKGLSALLYDKIIEKLNKSFGREWGIWESPC